MKNLGRLPAIMTGVDKALERPVKLLVFDMGHVFVKFDWERVCQGFCERAKISRPEFQQVLGVVRKLGYEKGECDTKQFLDKMNELMGSDITLSEFTSLWNHTFEEDVEMATLLQQLKSQLPLCVLSNTNENHHAFLQEGFDVERHFAHKIFSYKVRMQKPNLDIYKLVSQMSGFKPDECIFVDDLPENIEAARKAGLRPILFVGREPLIESLAQHGIVVAQ